MRRDESNGCPVTSKFASSHNGQRAIPRGKVSMPRCGMDCGTHVLVTDVLEQFELAVSTLGEDGGGEGLHDLLDGHRSVGELVVCGTDETEGTHSDGLQVDISSGDLKDGAEDGEFDKVGHFEDEGLLQKMRRKDKRRDEVLRMQLKSLQVRCRLGLESCCETDGNKEDDTETRSRDANGDASKEPRRFKTGAGFNET